MTLQELSEAKWDALVPLAAAVQAHRASHEAGLPTEGQVDALDALEATYTALHGRWTDLLDSGMDTEAA